MNEHLSRKLPLLFLFIILVSGRDWQGDIPVGSIGVLILFFAALYASPDPDCIARNRQITNRSVKWLLIITPPAAFLSLLVYWPYFSKEWMLLDDWEWLSFANNYVRQWTHDYHRVLIVRWFNFLDPENYTRVISVFTLMADIFVWGDNLAGFHFTNVLIHILNSVLCGFLVLRLTSQPVFALVSGITAAVNPIVFMSVAEINGRGDLVCTFFGLSSIICYLLAGERHPKTSKFWYVLAFISATFALFSKEMALALPAVLVFLEISRGNRFMSGPMLVRLAPFLVLDIIKLANLSRLPSEGLTFEGMIGGFFTFLYYTPHNLLLPFMPNDFSGELRVLLLSVIVIISFNTGKSRKPRMRLAAFGMLFTFAFMVPVYNFVTTSPLGNSRIFYMASFGCAMGIASFISPDLRLRGKGGKLSMALLLVFWVIIVRVNILFSDALLPQPDYSLEMRAAIGEIIEKPENRRIFFAGDSIDMERAEFFVERRTGRHDADIQFFRLQEPRKGMEMRLMSFASYPYIDCGAAKYFPFSFFSKGPLLWWDGVSRRYREAGGPLLSAINLPLILAETKTSQAAENIDLRWRHGDELILYQAYPEELEKKIPYRILESNPGRFPSDQNFQLRWNIKLAAEFRHKGAAFMIDIVPPPRLFPSGQDFFIPEPPVQGESEWSGSMYMKNYLSGNAVIADTTVILRFWLPSACKPVSGKAILTGNN